MKYRLSISYITILILLIVDICSAQSLEEQFQYVLDSTFHSTSSAVGFMVHVESPDNDVSWSYSVGYSNKKTRTILEHDQAVLIASNTKTYVSATILKLVENKKLQLDQPIKKLLYKKSRRLMKKAGYDLNKITIRHLLSHTSGITDYVDDDYIAFVQTNPNHRWTRSEQIALAAKVAKPKEVGKTANYADINFVLLTEIIERQTGEPFYTAIRQLLDFEKHKLNSTWFIDLEEAPKQTKPLAHQYSDKHGWDSYDLDPSWDLYGGGGIASTTEDLAIFFQRLFEGKIIQDQAILTEMHTYVIPREEAKNYCLGLYKLPSFFGYKAYYHGGFWGTDVMYLPELNTTISVFTLQKDQREHNAQISHEIVKILEKE